MSLATQPSLSATSVVVIKRDDIPAQRFQILPYGTDEAVPSPVRTFATQGEATSWLLCNGYQWIKDSSPHRWVKS